MAVGMLSTTSIDTFANIPRLKKSEQESETLLVVLVRLGSVALMSKIMEMVQQPIPDIKLASLILVKELVLQPWVQTYIDDTLKRNSETF